MSNSIRANLEGMSPEATLLRLPDSPLAALLPAAVTASAFLSARVAGGSETEPGLEGSKEPVHTNTSLKTVPGCGRMHGEVWGRARVDGRCVEGWTTGAKGINPASVQFVNPPPSLG